MSRSKSDSTPVEVVTPRQYKKLNKFEEYDKEAAEEMAAAMEERNTLQKRINVLNNLIDENEELKPFVWTTADGKSKALHQVEDDHLANILQWIFGRGQAIPKSLRAEATKRNMEVPETDYDRGVRMIEGTPNYREHIYDLFED